MEKNRNWSRKREKGISLSNTQTFPRSHCKPGQWVSCRGRWITQHWAVSLHTQSCSKLIDWWVNQTSRATEHCPGTPAALSFPWTHRWHNIVCSGQNQTLSHVNITVPLQHSASADSFFSPTVKSLFFGIGQFKFYLQLTTKSQVTLRCSSDISTQLQRPQIVSVF